ncbi:MAG TPA: hypothetical protein VGM88_32190 [Kofleriaceae bacterium]
MTRFPTAAEFVDGFGRYCTDTTCFIPTTERKTPGIETGFSIRLSDGTPVLRGLCVVLDSWSASESPFKRAGVNLGIRSITPESREVFERLQAARDTRASAMPIAVMAGNEVAARAVATTPASTAKPPPVPPPRDDLKPTVEMAPLFAAESIVPANPLTDISDAALADFIDCMMYEDPVPTEEMDRGHTAPVVMVPVSAPAPIALPPPGREAIATILGVQPLRLTPVYAPLPRPPAHTPDEQPPPASPPAARDTQQTERIAVQGRWWRGVSRWLSRVAQLVRRPHATHATRAPEVSRRGPRRARTGLAPINSRPDRAP